MSDLGGFSLHELFRGEAETHAAALSEGLVKLEGTSNPAIVEPLMRAAHSIKGAARVIGLDIAVRLAHGLEDVLVAMQKGREAISSSRIDQLLRGADLLASLARVSEAEVAQWTATNSSAVDQLAAELMVPPPAAVQIAPAAAPTAPTGFQVPSSGPPAGSQVPPAGTTETTSQLPTAVPAAVPASIPAPTPATATATTRASSVRVTAEKLDRLLQLAGETMLESRRLGVIHEEALDFKRMLVRLEDELDRLRAEIRAAGLDPTLVARARGIVEKGREGVVAHLLTVESAIRRGEETSTQLYHEVLSSRMRPFADATASLPRAVRDLARALGKEARLEIVGESVPVDRDILARLDAPLNHLLRNALDHGVETPDERRAQGKPAQAVLRVEARHHAGMLHIRVSDDGRGIDIEAMRERIVRRALTSREMAATMERQELLEFLFLPGFSTAAQITEISGRGVGLDVVALRASTLNSAAAPCSNSSSPSRSRSFARCWSMSPARSSRSPWFASNALCRSMQPS